MRIKRFNENSEEDKRYPKKVTQQEFFDKRSKFRMEDFSQSERTPIIEILNKKGLHRTDIRFNNEYVEISLGWSEAEVVKFHDEWFTIIISDRWNQKEFYICDGFEELESWLNMI